MLYGQAVPSLTGTLTGVLAQDTGNVAAAFTTTATSRLRREVSDCGGLTGMAAADYA